MKTVGVSASTGLGMEPLFKAIDQSKEEYYEFYHKELQERAQVWFWLCVVFIKAQFMMSCGSLCDVDHAYQ